MPRACHIFRRCCAGRTGPAAAAPGRATSPRRSRRTRPGAGYGPPTARAMPTMSAPTIVTRHRAHATDHAHSEGEHDHLDADAGHHRDAGRGDCAPKAPSTAPITKVAVYMRPRRCRYAFAISRSWMTARSSFPTASAPRPTCREPIDAGERHKPITRSRLKGSPPIVTVPSRLTG